MRRREDPIIDSAIRKALGSRLSLSSSNCPDDNAVAAYLEQKLSLAERTQLEDHASTCVQCQEVLALSMKLNESQGGDVVDARPARTVLFRFSFTLSSLALLVVAVAGGILLLQIRNSQKSAAIQQTAELQASGQRPQPAASVKSPSASVSRDGRELSTESTDVKRRPGPAARDEVFRLREGARDKDSNMRAAAKESAEAPKERITKREEVGFPAQSRDDIKKQGVAGQVADRTQGFPGGERDGLLQVQSNEPKPQVTVIAPAQSGGSKPQAAAGSTNVVVAEMADKSAQMTPRSAIDAFSLQFADETRTYDIAKPGANRKLESARPASRLPTFRKVGSKTFYLLAGYWIDSDCRGRSAAQIEEVSEEDARFLELSKEFPGIEELRSSRLPVLLHRGEKNYVIRFRTP